MNVEALAKIRRGGRGYKNLCIVMEKSDKSSSQISKKNDIILFKEKKW